MATRLRKTRKLRGGRHMGWGQVAQHRSFGHKGGLGRSGHLKHLASTVIKEDPDHFGVEGGGVVVRGLTHVRSEFYGRDSFSATSDRGLSFEDVSPELMGSVAVYKNQTADMIEGGIAGTIVLNTRKPFDQDKRVISLSLDTTYTDIREENSPSFSALYSDTWDTDSGRWGFLVNASKSTLKVESRGTQVGLYRPQNRDMTKFVPESARITDKQDDSNRAGFASSLQWESTDKTVLVTAEYIRSEADVTWHENAIDFNDSTGGNLLPIAGTEFEYDENGFFESGIMNVYYLKKFKYIKYNDNEKLTLYNQKKIQVDDFHFKQNYRKILIMKKIILKKNNNRYEFTVSIDEKKNQNFIINFITLSKNNIREFSDILCNFLK